MKHFHRLSALSLMLLAVSAVVAAILPEKSKDPDQANSADNATLISCSGDAPGCVANPKSCVPDGDNDVVYSCHLSLNATVTTMPPQIYSDGFTYYTYGNTSNSQQGTGHLGDTTSIGN